MFQGQGKSGNFLKKLFDSLRPTHVVVVVSSFCCECFLPNSFSSKREEVENEEKNKDGLQKKLKRMYPWIVSR